MTIWFPVASKYAYLVIFGTESYSQARMPDSDDIDTDKHKTNKLSDNVEPAVLQSDVIKHKAHYEHEGSQ
ncbi:hypothetical protein N7504_005897 [Penicillium tannophilum]|nr:hypothetical protein N7504_005897 [Penicillium tannophilum]